MKDVSCSTSYQGPTSIGYFKKESSSPWFWFVSQPFSGEYGFINGKKFVTMSSSAFRSTCNGPILGTNELIGFGGTPSTPELQALYII